MSKQILSKRLLFNVLMASQLAASAGFAPAALAEDGSPGPDGKGTNHREAAAARPHIDLAFCIDTTGSMQNEIDNVKEKTKEIVAKLAGGKPTPVIRVGLVAYRDRGDEYVTKTFQFTEDIDKVVKDISSLKADGGGDAPESVNEALHVAVNDLKWDGGKKTLKLLFLIGDAGPHYYANDYDWRTESKTAISRGIQINTLGCQGLEGFPEKEGVGVFKEIARLTDGQYESLAYRQAVARAGSGGATVISSAGKTYLVKAKDREAWRAGADRLSSMGLAESVGARGIMMKGAPMAGFAAAAPMARPVAGFAMSESAASTADMAAGPGMVGGSLSRADSNLADLVLARTKKAASEKLQVDFKTK